MKKMMILLLTLMFLLCSCGGGTKQPDAVPETPPANVEEPAAPAEPKDDPVEEPIDPPTDGPGMEREEPTASADIPLYYEAVLCTLNGDRMVCQNEYLYLNEDGTGYVGYNDDEYEITWTLKGQAFSFVDSSGDTFNGIINGEEITGIHAVEIDGELTEYNYIYQTPDMIAANPVEDDVDDFEKMIFEAVSCTLDGDDVFTEGEMLTLNWDGTGTFIFVDTEYQIEWSYSDDEVFSFVDETGDIFEGVLNDDDETIEGTYYVAGSEETVEFEYVFAFVSEE